MTITRYLAFLFVLVTLPAAGQAPVALRVLHAPYPVVIGGRPVIYYELVLTNTTPAPQVVKRLTVFHTGDSSILRMFNADDLRRRYASLPPAPVANGLALDPQTSGVIYIELDLPAKNVSALPVAHALEVTGALEQRTVSVQGGAFVLSTETPIIFGAPLRGGPWAAIYEPSWPRGHRRVVYATDGTPRIPGRFAIDFILLGADSKMSTGDENVIANWHGYAADVLAVSDGVVAATRDDFAESPTLAGHPAYPPEKATGNYIVLDIGHGRYVFYEHLKPQSITVKPGQKIKKGDRIAALGFTGQTTGPHLHLHVANGNSPLGAEGLPFAFERFTLLGAYPGLEGLGERPWVQTQVPDSLITQERPGPNSVINFE